MNRLVCGCLLPLVATALAFGKDNTPGLKTHQVQLNGHTFTLPEGFEIELVAAPPLVDRPIVADFDEQGRLYVADSSGSNEKVDIQVQKRPHRIVRLEDSHGDGHFDKATVFADKMMFPEGCMWLGGSLYVAAPPSIWKLTDTDGDGVADQREEWFKGKTLTGCANDLHGPYRGPDGWIYWCKGAFAKQEYKLPNGKPFTTRASHIFRCRPDGSGIEPVMTGGMDNPVDVVFTPGGERIFTTTFFQHPGGGQRDGLIHALYGGVYGKDHDVVYEHKWTGPSLMPVLTHMGPAAPCGLTRYESEVFGQEYKDNLFACQFNMHKVSRHVPEPSGATFTTRDEDFLLSGNLDFHPTDVIEDADGSLLVLDTGGWYKLCCPTSQLVKPDVLGGIYRIRKKGAAKVEDPRGLKLAWDKMGAKEIANPKELATLLGDPRPAVRRRAIETFAAKGAEVVPALDWVMENESGETCRSAIWTAVRIDVPAARTALRAALDDDEETSRQAAAHAVSLWRDKAAVPELIKLLQGPSVPNRRAAAEALGRIGDKSAVPALLDALGQPRDRALEHSLIYALIEIGDRDGTAAGLNSANIFTRRAALIALDQMDGGKLEARIVAAELNARVPELKEAALWIVGHHPEWGGELAGMLRDRLGAKNLPAEEREELVRQLARFSRTPTVQEFLAERLRDATAPVEARRTVLRVMARAGLREVPEAWVAALTAALASDDIDLVREAATTVRAWPIPKKRPEKLVEALLHAATVDRLPPDVRLIALAAVPGGLDRMDDSLFSSLTQHLAADQPVTLRAAAAEVLAHAKLTSEQLLILADILKTTGPMETDRLLDAFEKSKDDRVGHRLLAALGASPARTNLRVDSLRQRLAKYGPDVQREAETLYAALNADEGKQKAKLEEMLASLKGGDIRRGQIAFNSTKAACASCHAIGYLGGKIGPDLTRIGQIRTERDLLESIIFPSASFVRSYEPVKVTTKDGKAVNGLIKKDTLDEVVLTVSATEEVRIARDDIESMVPGKVSIMPAGLDQQLTPQELADLVAFLKACR
jgi:putative membrane-bound dehydrogenase-like protein